MSKKYKLKTVLFTALRQVVAQIFPAYCKYCRKRLRAKDWASMCLRCQATLRQQQKTEAKMLRCIYCGARLENSPFQIKKRNRKNRKNPFVFNNKVCADCCHAHAFYAKLHEESRKIHKNSNKTVFFRWEDRALRQAVALFDNCQMARQVVYDYKFYGELGLATLLADLAARRYGEFLQTFNAVVPVPANRIAEAERGYCPVDFFAHRLAKKIKIPLRQWFYRDENKRLFFKPPVNALPQKEKNLEERWQNTMQRYRLKKGKMRKSLEKNLGAKPTLAETKPTFAKKLKSAKNKHAENVLQESSSSLKLLLVDDVMTSGATLHGLAVLLKRQMPRAEISALCLLRTLYDTERKYKNPASKSHNEEYPHYFFL